jgi:peroxiredoxin
MNREATGLKLPLGSTAPYFSLKGTDSKIYSLPEFAEAKVLVVIFTANHCPYAQSYEKRICSLAEIYRTQGVQFVAICSNDAKGYPEDNFENMVRKSEQLGFPFPYLQDETQVTARAYDAACTPECYVFDYERKLRYHGRVDDNHRDPTLVAHHDLADAIEALLAGKEVAEPLTPCIGCSIKWKA